MRTTSRIAESSASSLKGLKVTGKENEPLASGRADPRQRPVEHLAPDPWHHHVANDEIEGVLDDLAQALDATRDWGHLKRAGNQVIVKNLPEIIAIFQEQNPLARPERVVRGILFAGHRYLYCVKVEGEVPHGRMAEVRQWKLPSRTHSPKPKSKTDTVHAP